MSSHYSEFDIRLVVDVVEIEIETTKATQAKHIFDSLNGQASYVCGCNPQTRQPYPEGLTNTTTNVFRLTIQEPKRFSDIGRLFTDDHSLTYVGRKYALKTLPSLTKLEVALDVYCKGADQAELADIATDLYRFSINKPESQWYFYRCKDEGRQLINESDSNIALTRNEIASFFREGWQLTDCDKNKFPPVRMHIYVKMTDSGGVGLDQCDWRARAEATLQGAALPCRTLGELATLDFGELADYFRFRRLADKLHPMAAHALDRFSGRQHGRAGAYQSKSRNRIGHHSAGRANVFRRSTQANDYLNRRVVGEGLRGLSRSWRKAPKGELTQFRGNFDTPDQGFMQAGAGLLTIGTKPTPQESTQATEHEGKQRLPLPSAQAIAQSQKSAAPVALKSAAQTCPLDVVGDFMRDFDATPGLADELRRVEEMMPLPGTSKP